MKCPLCGNKKGLIPVMKVAYPEIEYRMIHCPVCGLTFAFPMVEAPKEYYAEKEWYGERWEFAKVWEIIKGGSGNLLEIGCGEGFFLEKSRGKGYNLYGIDINNEAIARARQRVREAHLHSGSLNSLPKTFPQKYNVVCVFHVLEHTKDPVGFMENINSLLENKGTLFLSVPSPRRAQKFVTGRESWDLPPHHLTWWNKYSISTLMKKTGFVTIYFEYEPLRFNYVKGFIEEHLKKIYQAHKRKNHLNQASQDKEQRNTIKKLIKYLIQPFVFMLSGIIFLIGLALGFKGQSLLLIAKKKTPLTENNIPLQI